MKKYSFTVLMERDEDNGFIATVPELKGCHTQGDTMVELMANVEEAISLCLEVYQKDRINVFNTDYIETKKMEMDIQKEPGKNICTARRKIAELLIVSAARATIIRNIPANMARP